MQMQLCLVCKGWQPFTDKNFLEIDERNCMNFKRERHEFLDIPLIWKRLTEFEIRLEIIVLMLSKTVSA
jgi:hypothetical protein